MENMHHALLVRTSAVKTFLLSSPDTIEVNDVYFSKFGIDEAKDLTRQVYIKSRSDAGRWFVIRADFITFEAQNALLKVLEEPPEFVVIVFVIPNEFIVLPTLASRFSEDKNIGNDNMKKEVSAQHTDDFSKFMTHSYCDRLQDIERALKKKDEGWQKEIKKGLISYLRAGKEIVIEYENYDILVYIAEKLLTRGASNKMLLEHLALTLATRSGSNKVVH